MTHGSPHACLRCGHALGARANFCGACGADRDGAPPTSRRSDSFMAAVLREADAGGSVQQAVAGLLVAVGAFVALLFILGVANLNADGGLAAMRLGDAAILGVGLVGAALRWRQVRPTLSLPRITGGGLALASGGLALVWLTSQLLTRIAPTTDGALVGLYHAEELPLWVALVDLAVLPAVTEELVFRGVILGGLLQVFRPQAAIVTTAVLFGAVHLSPLSMVHLTMMGLVLGAVRVGSGSLYPCILLHALYNAVIVLGVW